MNRLHIFDMDGTLIDSMSLWKGIENKYLKREGIDQTTVNGYDSTMGLSPKDRYIWISENIFNGSRTADEINKECVDMVLESYKNVKFFPGAIEYLRICKAKGHKIAIATANFRSSVNTVLAANNIPENFFDAIVCNRDGKDKVAYDKNTLFHECIKLTDSSMDLTTIYEDSEYVTRHAYEGGFRNLVLHHTNDYDISNIDYKMKIVYSMSELPTDMDAQVALVRHAKSFHGMIDDYINCGIVSKLNYILTNIGDTTIPMCVFENIEYYLLPGFRTFVLNNKVYGKSFDPNDIAI